MCSLGELMLHFSLKISPVSVSHLSLWHSLGGMAAQQHLLVQCHLFALRLLLKVLSQVLQVYKEKEKEVGGGGEETQPIRLSARA